MTILRNSFRTDDARYAAVLNHDSSADGQFVYSVKTTGVYCRPSCHSRTALRRNVRFHDSPLAAEQAGFRPCKRCQPDGPALAEYHTAKIAAACRTIESAEKNPGLALLAREAGMSRFHFHRVFKKITGLTPKAYALAHRADRVRLELSRRNTVTEAIYESGFNSNGRFYANSSSVLGMKPRQFRQGGAGELIRFAVGKCSLGSILVALSKKGVCAISVGDQPEVLIRDLRDMFPSARLVSGDKQFASVIAKVIAFVEAPGIGLDLPLDLRGTVFQRRVWKALREIPAGTTASYLELAVRIGAPRAIRAVASACASNKLAVAIPCHRALRNDGRLSGYRWGIKRKQTLLRLEAGQSK
jgi:AraC family transcriptional regulator of adaptative response/methylated-DNA-[protein]-cysteine methyltransferase